MVIASGIGGTGAENPIHFDGLDNFQSELHFWNTLLTNLRTGDTAPPHDN